MKRKYEEVQTIDDVFLPHHLMCLVFDFLPSSDVAKYSRVCEKWHDIARNRPLSLEFNTKDLLVLIQKGLKEDFFSKYKKGGSCVRFLLPRVKYNTDPNCLYLDVLASILHIFCMETVCIDTEIKKSAYPSLYPAFSLGHRHKLNPVTTHLKIIGATLDENFWARLAICDTITKLSLHTCCYDPGHIHLVPSIIDYDVEQTKVEAEEYVHSPLLSPPLKGHIHTWKIRVMDLTSDMFRFGFDFSNIEKIDYLDYFNGFEHSVTKPGYGYLANLLNSVPMPKTLATICNLKFFSDIYENSTDENPLMHLILVNPTFSYSTGCGIEKLQHLRYLTLKCTELDEWQIEPYDDYEQHDYMNLVRCNLLDTIDRHFPPLLERLNILDSRKVQDLPMWKKFVAKLPDFLSVTYNGVDLKKSIISIF